MALDSGKSALKRVFVLIASTSFSGVTLAGSYLAQAQFFLYSAFASFTPSTFMSAARTAAAHPFHVIPRTYSSTSFKSSAREFVITPAKPANANRKFLRFILTSSSWMGYVCASTSSAWTRLTTFATLPKQQLPWGFLTSQAQWPAFTSSAMKVGISVLP